MSSTPDDAWLIALGSAVSDGSQVDWDAVESRSTTAEERALVRHLRQLAGVVGASRSAAASGGSDAAAATPPAASVAPARPWRHLVLFECIGSGAFGHVYRGFDPPLDRDVAVKLLAKTAGAVGSPLEEARHLARLRHPNVVLVHGADEDAGTVGIWMEYVEGETLAAIVAARGPMSPREATGIGLDLCSALSAIHGAGLLHRDIKAQNVMREVGGRIVLMDFSGARSVRLDENPDVILSGTPAYMAPELFTGAPPSTAADVYSLGVLLFFLLTAEFPVEGATARAIAAGHAAGSQKRLRDLRPDLPDGLVQVIERSIDRDPARRFRTAGELEHALLTASAVQTLAAAGPRVTRRAGPWVLAATLAAAVVTLTGVALWPAAPPPSPLARFLVGPPHLLGSWPRVSPDGRYLAYGTLVEGRNRIWIRPLDRDGGYPLMETTANETPFWAPDGRSLAFFGDGTLQVVPVEGGTPRTLAEAPYPRGGDWHGHTLIFARVDGLYSVDARGGAAVQLTTVDQEDGEYQHGWPEFLPDGRRFLYLVRSADPDRQGLYLGSLTGGAPRRLGPASSRAVYHDRHLLYVRHGTLVAHPFDVRAATFDGEPVEVAHEVRHHIASDAAFDISLSGVLTYALRPGLPSSRLVLMDRRGRELKTLTDLGAFSGPRFSPDGERVVAEKVEQGAYQADIWVYGVARPLAARLTRSSAQDLKPAWSPDGREVVFSSKRDLDFDVYTKVVDSVEDEQLRIADRGNALIEHWSPDGRYVTATVLRSGLWLLPMVGGEQARLIREHERAETWQSEFSPDGRWLAYMSSESGKPEVYVEPFPTTGARWQISANGGTEPHWAGGSRELIYLRPDGVLTSASPSGADWSQSTSQPLFRVSVPDLQGRNDFAVSPDGRHLVVNTLVAEPTIPPVDVLVNWRVPQNR